MPAAAKAPVHADNPIVIGDGGFEVLGSAARTQISP